MDNQLSVLSDPNSSLAADTVQTQHQRGSARAASYATQHCVSSNTALG